MFKNLITKLYKPVQHYGNRSMCVSMESRKNTIKVLSTKVCDVGNENNLKDYVKELHEEVENAPGFKDSETYFVPESDTSIFLKQGKKMVTISEWSGFDNWDDWFKSESRTKISEKYKDSIEEESHKKLEYFANKYEMFLL